jgi:hypothetical protein
VEIIPVDPVKLVLMSTLDQEARINEAELGQMKLAIAK